MADEFNTATNWWDSSRKAGSSSSSSGFSFGWPTEVADVKTARSQMDSVSGSSVVFHENPKLHQAMDLQIMGLGLSSQAMDWNQALLRGETEFKQMNTGFSLHQSQFSPHGSPGDNTGTYRSFQSENSTALYDQNPWSQEQHHHHHQLHGQLHFSNNAPFWNPSAASMADHVRPGFSPSLQPQFPTGNFDEKPKNISEVRDSSSTVVKKSGNESKRPRNETPATMPAFKVRKEKMGDRITALQQLVSPFGKTDTASVLSEAIEYIKFLHEQVSVLSTPYMKNNEAAIQQQQNPEKSKDSEGLKQDLRSRGLCLVPVSSTFPLTHDSSVDFWTPTFGGTFR